jgi:hypothetical protein
MQWARVSVWDLARERPALHSVSGTWWLGPGAFRLGSEPGTPACLCRGLCPAWDVVLKTSLFFPGPHSSLLCRREKDVCIKSIRVPWDLEGAIAVVPMPTMAMQSRGASKGAAATRLYVSTGPVVFRLSDIQFFTCKFPSFQDGQLNSKKTKNTVSSNDFPGFNPGSTCFLPCHTAEVLSSFPFVGLRVPVYKMRAGDWRLS